MTTRGERFRTAHALRALASTLLFAGVAAADPTVHASPDAVQPLPPGATVPSATVRTVTGDAVDLAALVRERGALLVFYRGGW